MLAGCSARAGPDPAGGQERICVPEPGGSAVPHPVVFRLPGGPGGRVAHFAPHVVSWLCVVLLPVPWLRTPVGLVVRRPGTVCGIDPSPDCFGYAVAKLSSEGMPRPGWRRSSKDLALGPRHSERPQSRASHRKDLPLDRSACWVRLSTGSVPACKGRQWAHRYRPPAWASGA